MSPGPTRPWDIPLVGRTDLVARLAGELVAANSAFVLAGSPGIGKSRVAAEVARSASEQGLATSHVAATKSAASIPFGAFALLMPEIVEPPGGLVSVLRSAADAILERSAGGRRLLMIVDDAHFLDDGSAALVHLLVRESSCSLVATIRSQWPVPDTITSLWKDDLAERLDITALSQAEVKELAAAMLGGPVTDSGVRWLWDVSGGNPLYLRELLIGALDSGALRDEGGVWTLRLPLPAPPRLAELVAARLAELPRETAEAVDLVALGEPLPLDVLGALAPQSALEDAEARGVIRIEEKGGILEARMDHPIYGEVRRHEIAPIRLRRLCTELARAMEQRSSPRQGDELRIARWQVEAGLPGDPVLLGRAAMAARRVFDMDLAFRLAKASLDAGGGIEAGLALAEANFFSGLPEEAEAVLAALVPRCVDDDEIARVADARSYNLGVMLGDRAAAIDVVEAALAAVREPGPRYTLLNRRATIDVYSDKPRDALVDARELIASGDDERIGRGAYVGSWALAMLGRGDTAVEMASLGMEAHERSGDTSRLASAHLIGAVVGNMGAGRFEDAERAALAGYAMNAEVHAAEGLATFALMRGWLCVEQGRLAEAAKLLREGVAANRSLRDDSTLRWCTGALALATGMAGDAAAAAAAIAELDSVPPHWMDALDSDLVLRGRAWARAAAGELTAARQELKEAAVTARRREQRYAEARLLHDLARLGDAGHVARRLRELAGLVEGVLVEAFADDAAALISRRGSELQSSAEGFELLGALGLASETLQAASAAYELEGLASASAASARRAVELDEKRGAAGGPGVSQGGAAGRLTRREREIAGLAASGLPSREIGARLHISARTVEDHLANVYLKLGVTRRQELAAALQGD